MRAAQYVRMSTEHQQYSTENQSVAIGEYAAKRGITIVRTFEDAGKSGLRIEGRESLKQLIEVVQSGAADFETILVYDVSRWGRFQDADESAYYEYICKRAGVTVQYCAEQFNNDGTPGATIIKTVKRAMAGEYSRELSVKVFDGQCRLIERGYRQGGAAGYGLRRMLIDVKGNAKTPLARGEQKSFQMDRVILVPGPAEEVDIVREIYRLFIHEGLGEAEIARRLNERGIPTDRDCPWTRAAVHGVLTNEKYVGHNVYNRVSFKLKKKRVRNPPDMWVRANGVFEPLVEAQDFDAALRIILDRHTRLSDEELLDRLRALHDRTGILSGFIIDESEEMPSSAVYRKRFGSLVRAYELIGYTPDRDYSFVAINRALRQLHPRMVADVVASLQRLGGQVESRPDSDLFTLNGELTVSIVLARCLTKPTGARWHVLLERGLLPDITIAVRMDASNEAVLDYYLLPSIDMSARKLRLAEDNGVWLDAFRFETLDYFFGMAERTRVSEVS